MLRAPNFNDLLARDHPSIYFPNHLSYVGSWGCWSLSQFLGNTLDGWPVHCKVSTHTLTHLHTYSHPQAIYGLSFTYAACLWIMGKTTL